MSIIYIFVYCKELIASCFIPIVWYIIPIKSKIKIQKLQSINLAVISLLFSVHKLAKKLFPIFTDYFVNIQEYRDVCTIEQLLFLFPDGAHKLASVVSSIAETQAKTTLIVRNRKYIFLLKKYQYSPFLICVSWCLVIVFKQ